MCVLVPPQRASSLYSCVRAGVRALQVSIRQSGGGSEGTEGYYYPSGSMGALCLGQRRGEGQGGERRPVIMFFKSQCTRQEEGERTGSFPRARI